MPTTIRQADEWRVGVVLRTGERVPVDVDALVGPFAVHRRLTPDGVPGPADGMWTVTHVAAGVAVWHAQDFQAAVRVAQKLEASKLLPEGRSELLLWAQTSCRDAVARTKFLVQLRQWGQAS